jgi:hypothetical protein
MPSQLRMPTAKQSRKPLVVGLGLAILAAAVAIGVVLATRGGPPAADKRPAPTDPIALALYNHQAALDGCTHQGSAKLPHYARASVFVEPDGKVYDVQLEPSASADSDVGKCVRDQLRAITFPSGKSRAQIIVALNQH